MCRKDTHNSSGCSISTLRAVLPAKLRTQGLVGIVGFLMIYAISALLSLVRAYG